LLSSQAEQKWKQLAELATSKCEFGLAQECLRQAQDFGGLLLLATAAGNGGMVQSLADNAEAAGLCAVRSPPLFLHILCLAELSWHISNKFSRPVIRRNPGLIQQVASNPNPNDNSGQNQRESFTLLHHQCTLNKSKHQSDGPC